MGCYFMIFCTSPFDSPLIRFKFVTKWIRLKPSEFRYSVVENIDKYNDGHTNTYYTAFIQFERFGKKYNIGWMPSKSDPLTPDILDSPNVTLEVFKRINDCNIVVNRYYYIINFPEKEMAEYAVEVIKNRVKKIQRYLTRAIMNQSPVQKKPFNNKHRILN